MRPGADRVKPIAELLMPSNAKELQRLIGMFSYYAQSIPQFSEKIKPLIIEKQFPLGEKARQALEFLKSDLTVATLRVIDENLPFVIETDASENATSASLNQENRPVAFFTRMLNKNEMSHPSI